MIDWVNLGSNALWIVGLSIVLSTLSYASWAASVHNEKLTTRLKQTSIRFFLNLGGLSFCLGLAATSGVVLIAILWVVLAALFVTQLYVLKKNGKY